MSLNIAGWSKFSTVDWPGEIVATLFLQGCPLHCGYCHNYEILDPKVQGDVSFEKDVLPLLKKRTTLLDGVVFSGGEALMQAKNGGELRKAIEEVKKISSDYKIGLHTSGIYYENLKSIIDLVDWIGFDIKANKAKVDQITGVKGSVKVIEQSLQTVLEERDRRKSSKHPLDVQFRTTIDPTVLNEEDIEELKNEVAQKGITDLVLQKVRTIGASEEYARKLEDSLSR
jgi:pyruvate formate lyase activating enzyme